MAIIKLDGCAKHGQGISRARDNAAFERIFITPGDTATGVNLLREESSIAVVNGPQRYQRCDSGLLRQYFESFELPISDTIDFKNGLFVSVRGNFAEVAMANSKWAQLDAECLPFQVDPGQQSAQAS